MNFFALGEKVSHMSTLVGLSKEQHHDNGPPPKCMADASQPDTVLLQDLLQHQTAMLDVHA